MLVHCISVNIFRSEWSLQYVEVSRQVCRFTCFDGWTAGELTWTGVSRFVFMVSLPLHPVCDLFVYIQYRLKVWTHSLDSIGLLS